MEAHLRLEAKLDQELWLIIVHYISHISYDFKIFGEKYEKGVFSVVPVRYVLFEDLPNPAPTVHSLTGRS